MKLKKSMIRRLCFFKSCHQQSARFSFALGDLSWKECWNPWSAQNAGGLLGTATSEYASLTALKEYVCDGGNLIYPSAGVMKTLKDYEEHFTAINSWCTDKIITMKLPVRSLTTYLSNVHRSRLEVCTDHKEAIYSMLTERYARLRLRIHLRQFPAGSSNSYESKTCAGVNLS